MKAFLFVWSVFAFLLSFVLGLAYLFLWLPLYLLFLLTTYSVSLLAMVVAGMVAGVHRLTRSIVRRTN